MSNYITKYGEYRMFSKYVDYWEELPVDKDLYNSITEQLIDGNTFQFTVESLLKLKSQLVKKQSLFVRIYCYHIGNIYYCKVSNDVRREIIRDAIKYYL